MSHSTMRATPALALTVLAACGPSGKRPAHPGRGAAAAANAPSQPTGRITFDCEPADAHVTVDGDAWGTAASIAARGGLELPQGLHRIEISRPGYRTFRFELILKDTPEKIEVRLKRAEEGR